MSQRVTMEDIARRSGVSLTTVSLVLRDKPGINDETRRRVMEVARELGYRKRSSPDTSGGQSLQQIGVITKARAGDQPQVNPFYGPVVAGIEAACRRQQINLLYATVAVDLDNYPEDLPRMLAEAQLDGIILVGAFVDHTIDQLLQRRGLPAVLVDAYASTHAYDAVVSDNFRGAYEAVSYLIGLGHRRIGLAGTLPDAYPSIAERRNGYLQALADHQISERYFADTHLVHEEIEAATAALLSQHPAITALFCANDMTAISAMAAARTLRRHLPEDLSVVGFDDIDLAAHVTPGLTTMHVDKISMGRLAVQALAHRLEFPETSCVTTVLRPSLVERQSARRLISES
ncbi:MAG: LacI family DNA-binding transcriptional regulator [Roseiflexaceae bacterium]